MGTSFILSIGVNTYRPAGIGDLNWAVADATAFRDAAVRGRDAASVRSLLLTEGDATTANIRESLGGWLSGTKPDDNVLAFFAGHGGRELRPDDEPLAAPEAYLLPSDVAVDRLYSTGFSLNHELPIVRKRIRARNVTLIFDCCYAGSGAGFPDGTRSRGIDGPLLSRRLALSDVGLDLSRSWLGVD